MTSSQERTPAPASAGATDLGHACRAVLLAADPLDKVKTARRAARDWRLGRTDFAFCVAMPDAPARTDRPPLLPPNRMPRRGKAGSERGRIAMLHALAHIEYVAIDLAFDLVGRFGAQFPRAFADRWLQVGAEEAMHFALIERRLHALGTSYGDLPAHDGLWEAAAATAHDPLARLAVVPMVLEARALDVTPAMIDRFATAGDDRSAAILRRIAEDEIGHVRAGVEWFESACAAQHRFDYSVAWGQLVACYFRGMIKPPFNDSSRERAGLTKAFMAGVAGWCDPKHSSDVAAGGAILTSALRK
ncbi:ferritin-like domain-containing protein [Sphingomonas montanisoli]|uniref:Ferritin-like domain-containing protein n=1 Tax=Sphingomonas montanisoli TaxID=2606412 RepID=A0A5D9C8W4_9SPHN|nr:ferritin-like domain-containing protein [Sphingomonas montanisoli]TZG27747.1 ferritin-like domain-containing protein [Sphingomonas montanisoli]